jgi:hypothetical protein
MNIIRLESFNNKGLRFLIEGEYPDIGAYLYIYEGDKCIRDEIQDTIEICKDVAFEDYKVPLDSWIEVKI